MAPAAARDLNKDASVLQRQATRFLEMKYSEFVIFADESGDTETRNIDPNYPVFVLNFCIFDRTEYAENVGPGLSKFKTDYFGHDQIVLHWNPIRHHEPPFDFDQDPLKQHRFEQALNGLIAGMDFTVIAAAIDKRSLRLEHAKSPDLYGEALRLCLELTYDFLWGRRQHELLTKVIIESRGKKENRWLQRAFQRICAGDNALGKPLSCFEMTFAPKGWNDAGLQIADRIAHPIGRHTIEPDQPNWAWEQLVEPNLYRSPHGEANGRGLIEFADP